MIKSKFAIALHIMTFVAKYDDDWIASSLLAKSININPVLVRKELALLNSKFLIESKEGKNGGVRLMKSASKITLAEIFKAVKGEDTVLGFCKNEGYENCEIGSQMKNKLTNLYSEIDNNIENQLSQTTLEEFKNQF